MNLNPHAPFSSLPVRRVTEHPLAPMPRDVWPATIPAVRQLLDEGLDCAAITVLVGENGAGKSTIVEAIAEAFGWGIRATAYDDLELVQSWRLLLDAPERILRHLG